MRTTIRETKELLADNERLKKRIAQYRKKVKLYEQLVVILPRNLHCEDFDHPKQYQHEFHEDCPLVNKYKNLLDKISNLE
jgi:hypothetical protein